MRRLHSLSVRGCLGLTLCLSLLLPARPAKADLTVNNIGLYDGTSKALTAWISFTGSGGYVNVCADPQTATNWTSHGSPIALYCTDTMHSNSLGDTYSVKPESTLPPEHTTLTYTDAANRVAWALEQVASTANARGATQLLIWAIVDKNFRVNWAETITAASSQRTSFCPAKCSRITTRTTII
jgi:hypothetical protein